MQRKTFSDRQPELNRSGDNPVLGCDDSAEEPMPWNGRQSVKLSVDNRDLLLQHATLRRYPSNYVLYRRGNNATYLCIVLSGEVELFIEDQCRRMVISRQLTGDLIGAPELLNNHFRITSAITLSKCILAVIYSADFEQLIDSRPRFAIAMLHYLASTVTDSTLRLTMLPLGAYGRLRLTLEGLADPSGLIQGTWTHQQLAELIGCSRETIGKLMAELKRGQWLNYRNKQIFILRPLPEIY